MKSGTSSPSSPSVHISLKLEATPCPSTKYIDACRRQKGQMLSESHTDQQNNEGHQVYAKFMYAKYLNTNETMLPPFLSLYVSVASLITIGTLSTPTVSHRVRQTSKHSLLQTHIKLYEKI